MRITAKSNYVTETPENDRDVADLKQRFPHLPKGPVSYIPGKSRKDIEDERRDLLRSLYPMIRLSRPY